MTLMGQVTEDNNVNSAHNYYSKAYNYGNTTAAGYIADLYAKDRVGAGIFGRPNKAEEAKWRERAKEELSIKWFV